MDIAGENTQRTIENRSAAVRVDNDTWLKKRAITQNGEKGLISRCWIRMLQVQTRVRKSTAADRMNPNAPKS